MRKRRSISSARRAAVAKARGRVARRPVRRARGRTRRVSTVRRFARAARRTLRAVWRLPMPFRILAGAILLLTAWAGINLGYQVLRKPTELFFPVSGALAKRPPETWRTYGPLFNEHSTAVITPELLAALAQVESSGNPVARTYWRWRPTPNPLELYQPASSAVGMYQITDATFQEAKRYCIHDHVVVEEGPWDDPHSCWFNSLYTRVVPSHAIELASAMLDRAVARTLANQGFTAA